MYKVLIRPLAKKDIKEAALWYNSKKAGLGRRFTAHIRDKISRLKQDPHLYAIRYDDITTVVLDTFPYMIHLTIDDARRNITIIAVLHTSRNPDTWKRDDT